MPIAAQVTLGRDATTTRGNADETAAWAKENAIRSLIVVTAHYHMPRALTEIARAAPDLTLYPMPVTPHGLRDADGPAGRVARYRLLAKEYVKFLVGLAGPNRPDAAAPFPRRTPSRGARARRWRAPGQRTGRRDARGVIFLRSAAFNAWFFSASVFITIPGPSRHCSHRAACWR